MSYFASRQRLIHLLLCIMIGLGSSLTVSDTVLADRSAKSSADDLNEVDTSAKASALIDVTSGRLLHSENGDKPMRIASLTKIMTAIVAIEHGNLQDMVKVNKSAVGKEGSSIYIQLNEEMSLSNLLYGLMLRSGNDAAVAIAEHVGGSEEGFVHLMNEKASYIGLANTSFKNPHGLDQDGHYSTANDLAVLTAYALKNKAFAEIVKSKEKTAPNPHEDWDYRWKNKNKMLTLYEGADGVKTGYTKKALRCLVSSATRNKHQLVAVTIAAGDDWNDHRLMLDWGFEHFKLEKLAQKNKQLRGYPYQAGQTFYYPLKQVEAEQIEVKVIPFKDVKPFRFGMRGKMEWYLNNEAIGSIPIYDAKGIAGY
ncbi:D-alanyl-D-alanine carboxypeptidase family protein [Paenibacillus sp. GXUN7292]|uniref:D-alanyl-D-alanine carboxypeptidase family protein n=1 Tax=Paenibacillus sp. GXUN7292 TaxID=3422499 RepID=UPI003D7E4A03